MNKDINMDKKSYELNLIQHEYFKSNIAFDIPISDCSNLLIDYLKIGMESRVRSKGNSTN